MIYRLVNLAKSVEYYLQGTTATYANSWTTNSLRREYFIVINAESVELVAKKISFIVMAVESAYQKLSNLSINVKLFQSLMMTVLYALRSSLQVENNLFSLDAIIPCTKNVIKAIRNLILLAQSAENA